MIIDIKIKISFDVNAINQRCMCKKIKSNCRYRWRL